MRLLRPLHCALTSLLILAICFGLYLSEVPAWAALTAAFLGGVAPWMAWLFADEAKGDLFSL